MISVKPRYRWFADRGGWYLFPEPETPIDFGTHQWMNSMWALAATLWEAS